MPRGPLLRPYPERMPVQVLVRDNNVDQALRALKKKMQREGVFREMKLRRSYEKPSERRARGSRSSSTGSSPVLQPCSQPGSPRTCRTG